MDTFVLKCGNICPKSWSRLTGGATWCGAHFHVTPGCCWHRTFFGSAYQLRFSRVTTGGAAIYCNSFPQWNAPELSIFAAFGNFCRWKVTVVSSVWPSFTRLCANMQTRPTIAHGNSRALAQRGFGATFPDTLIKHTYLDEGPTAIT